jgi:uncharacterized protein YecT (DUF1311 family)
MRQLLAIAVLIASAAHAGPPSFCATDRSAAARLICADEELWTIDAEVYGEFNSWRSNVRGADRTARMEEHSSWLKARNERCGLNRMGPEAPIETLMTAKQCMLSAYKERKALYDDLMWK